MGERRIASDFSGSETRDGAGVRLHRVFGFGKTESFDPFLLFDAFGSDRPEDYLAGFPWHPHRGIETVTYMLEGSVRHGDSMGNSGVIGRGEVQWMTAGSGIIHEEMPLHSERGVHGFQLWVNLPRVDKMCAPRYRSLEAKDIPVAERDGCSVLVIAGSFDGMPGALPDIIASPTYLDMRFAPGGKLTMPVPEGDTAFAWLYSGGLARVGSGETTGSDPATESGQPSRRRFASPRCILFDREGDSVSFEAGSDGCRLIFARGRPLREPVAWRGPIVMNTQSELELAFRELKEGSFIKNRG